MKTEEELIREENARLVARVAELESQAAGREASHVTVIDTPESLARRLRAMTHISRIDPPVKDAMHLAASMLERLHSDGQWRPMRTAPRDGTVVELKIGNGQPRNGYATPMDWRVEGFGRVNPLEWRPAHPEWQEGSS